MSKILLFIFTVSSDAKNETSWELVTIADYEFDTLKAIPGKRWKRLDCTDF